MKSQELFALLSQIRPNGKQNTVGRVARLSGIDRNLVIMKIEEFCRLEKKRTVSRWTDKDLAAYSWYNQEEIMKQKRMTIHKLGKRVPDTLLS